LTHHTRTTPHTTEIDTHTHHTCGWVVEDVTVGALSLLLLELVIWVLVVLVVVVAAVVVVIVAFVVVVDVIAAMSLLSLLSSLLSCPSSDNVLLEGVVRVVQAGRVRRWVSGAVFSLL
jgi:hypothetical protein